MSTGDRVEQVVETRQVHSCTELPVSTQQKLLERGEKPSERRYITYRLKDDEVHQLGITENDELTLLDSTGSVPGVTLGLGTGVGYGSKVRPTILIDFWAVKKLITKMKYPTFSAKECFFT